MKQHTFFFSLALVGLISVLTLSSFYKPTQQEQSPQANESADNNSKGQTSQHKGSLRLSSSFSNDYYTPNHRVGHFYTEVVADRYTQEPSSSKHTPLNLSVVIDRSGSMAGDKIRNAKQAAKYIVDQLGPEDYLSIVIYDGSVDVLQSAVSVQNKYSIKNKIDGIFERGSTNLMGGALEGYNQVKRNYQSGYINRVLLLSDGLANQGITDRNQIEKIVRSKNNMDGISISTFGVGLDYNEDLMTAMAENGTGNYYFIGNANDISRIFEKELNGLSSVVAQNTELKITIPEFVNVERVYGCNYTQTGRVLTVKLRDIFANETKGILIRYKVLPGRNTTVGFATSLTYNDAEEDVRRPMSLYNTCEFTTDERLYNNSYSEWVETQVAIYESNENLELAMKEVDKGNYDEAKKIVRKNTEYLKSKPAAVQQAPAMQSAKTVNAEYETKLDNVENMATEDVKYMQKESKSSNYEIRAKKK